MKNVRVRFAPSPTGSLHIGSLRTALYNDLFVRRHGGTFVLRVEDTDRTRLVPNGTEKIIEILNWAGLVWDEGPFLQQTGNSKQETAIIQKGDYGPYIQSERLDIYKKYALELVEKGSAYYCFCTAERLDAMRKEQEARKEPPMYDKTCFKMPVAEVKKRLAEHTPHVIRLRVPEDGETVVQDLIHGEVRFKNAVIDHQVLMKSDGFPTYHLANVVDDHLMKITHVIRGDEWMSSTPKHVLLYRAFGWTPAQFAHLPLMLNKDRSKLSKRTGDVSVEDFRAKGYLPEALINFVALLGWNPSAEQEIYTVDQLAAQFSLEKVNKTGAVVNWEKLRWLNGEYIRKKDITTLVPLVKPWLAAASLLTAEITDEYLAGVLMLVRDRLDVLGEIVELADYFFFDALTYEPSLLRWKEASREQTIDRLTRVRGLLAGLKAGEWTKEHIEMSLKKMITDSALGNGETLWPMRVALTGRTASPGPFAVAAVLGKERTLARLDAGITRAS